MSARSILEARARGEREADIAAQLLGRDHALVQTLGLLAVLTRQSLVVGGVLVVAVSTGFAVGAAQASSVVIAASIVELVLILGIRVLIRIKRRQARCLIIQGSGALPLKSVAAERRAMPEELRSPRSCSTGVTPRPSTTAGSKKHGPC